MLRVCLPAFFVLFCRVFSLFGRGGSVCLNNTCSTFILAKDQLLNFGYTSVLSAFFCLLNGVPEEYSNTKPLAGRVQDGMRRPCEKE